MSITTDYVLSIWTLLSEPLKGLRKGIDEYFSWRQLCVSCFEIFFVFIFLDVSYV